MMKKQMKNCWVIIRGIGLTFKTMWKRRSLMPLTMMFEEQVINEGKGFSHYGTVFEYIRELDKKLNK